MVLAAVLDLQAAACNKTTTATVRVLVPQNANYCADLSEKTHLPDEQCKLVQMLESCLWA